MYLQWVSDHHCAEKSDSEDMEMWPLPSPAFEMLNRSNSQLLTSQKNTQNIYLFVAGKNSLPCFAKLSNGEEFEMLSQKEEIRERFF